MLLKINRKRAAEDNFFSKVSNLAGFLVSCVKSLKSRFYEKNLWMAACKAITVWLSYRNGDVIRTQTSMVHLFL